ncbi:hypothetical protein [Streptomyces sp. G-G2]|uniref:hypothetical protein n=1 Tax=Streptomyces sp. G-G2 TaxID=3046201 RepID=UPI0024BB9C46|nr:hypothetical protein [Streptomyces sp. G-G2]MDJ0385174.1 hypothetical protein [Streptomyces sp. G-G2]
MVNATTDPGHAEGTDAFLRHMIWRYPNQRQPVVALLGPRHAGKSTLLRSLSQGCGSTVVHAHLDFHENPLDPVSAAALVAFQMMRGWDTLRRSPVFHRFALGLLALNETLETDRTGATDQIRGLIQQYTRGTRQGRFATRLEEAAVTTMDVVATGALSPLVSGTGRQVVAAVRDQARPVIGSLLQSAARWGLRDALRWHVSIPEAEAAGSVDALIRLSSASRSAAVGPLLAAFLADAQDQAERHPALRSSCSCELPEGAAGRGRHDHAWVLLVDGAQTPAGRRFLSALIAARVRNRQGNAGASAGTDPIVVLAACDQWQPEWTTRWCEPWRTTPLTGTSQRRVPLLSRAARAQWAREDASGAADPDSVAGYWYPVWLDPMSEEQVGHAVDDPGSLAPPLPASVAHRLTGGHWGAVTAVREQREAAPPDEHATPVDRPLPTALDAGGRPLWARALEAGLPEGLATPAGRWTPPPPVVLAAAYLADARTADDPWVPAELTDLPHSLELLRRNLWVSTHARAPSRIREIGWGPADRPPALHPWLSRSALTALSAASPLAGAEPGGSDDAPGDPWHQVFSRQATALAAMAAARGGPLEAAEEQRLFYDLCLGRFAPVAEALAARFDQDHRAWVRLLDYLASAPCRLVHERPAPQVYAHLLAGIERTGRDVVAVATAKLLALLWLYDDPLTEHHRNWDAQIEEGFERLSHNSRLLDVSALQQAGALFA